VANPALDVFLNGTLAGTLRRKANGNLQFRYDKTYIEAGGMPLSLNLPLRTQAFPHRACLAFFGNLLPEEDVRAQVALTTGISAANDYALLERLGGDVAGAVTLLPAEEYEEGSEPDSLEVLSPARLDELLTGLPERPLAADEGGEIRISLAGAQSKLPVIAVDDGFALPIGSGHPTTHILKPEPSRFPGLVANEFFCMRLAEEDVLIGNCDAHGKNYSLLYDSRAPTLAPLYDLISTTAYPEVSSQMAMSVDGARNIEEVDGAAWSRLAGEAKVSPRFLEQRMGTFVDRVATAAPTLAARPEFDDPVVERIVAGIGERARRFG
jgi:HipA-like protein